MKEYSIEQHNLDYRGFLFIMSIDGTISYWNSQS